MIQEKRYRYGDVRESDGRIFWGYQKKKIRSGTISEYMVWLTPEKFEARRVSQNKNTLIRRKKQEVRDVINKRMRKMYSHNPQWAAAKKLRDKFRAAFKKHRATKCAKTQELLGCSFEFFKQHIEIQFKEGMSWENRRSFHIDHIKPLSHFDLTDPEQQKAAFHWSNLQPLYPIENFRKSKRVLTTIN
jgi:hypothetical protein